MIYGPLAHTIPTIASLNESNKRIYDLFINTTPTADIPPNGLYLYVDVRVLLPSPPLLPFPLLLNPPLSLTPKPPPLSLTHI